MERIETAPTQATPPRSNKFTIYLFPGGRRIVDESYGYVCYVSYGSATNSIWCNSNTAYVAMQGEVDK